MSESAIMIVTVTCLLGAVAYLIMTGTADETVSQIGSAYRWMNGLFGPDPGEPSGNFS